MKNNILSCVSAFTLGLAVFSASAGVIYPAIDADKTTFGASDEDVKVALKGVDTSKGAYVRLSFTGRATKPGRLVGARGLKGEEKLAMSWDAIRRLENPEKQEYCYYIAPGADGVRLSVQSLSELKDFKAELITEAEAKAWSDNLWKEVDAGDVLKQVLADYPIPDDPFAKLPRFKAALKDGKPFKVHFLGDSISQDTYFSLVTAQIRALFPKANLDFSIYYEGATGCSVYAGKYEKAVGAFKPDLLVICGLDNFRGNGFKNDAEAAAALKKVIVEAKKNGIEILYMPPAHSVDSRLLKDEGPLWSAGGTGWDAPWGKPCEKAKFDPGAKDFWTAQCYKPEARNAVLKETDVPCWDIYPQSYDFVARSGRPWGWFNRDCVHNNDRGRTLIAHLLLEYFKRAK